MLESSDSYTLVDTLLMIKSSLVYNTILRNSLGVNLVALVDTLLVIKPGLIYNTILRTSLGVNLVTLNRKLWETCTVIVL